MAQAFVTGATGFIGGNLVKRLQMSDHFDTINCVVRNPEKARLLESQKVKIFKGDITDLESMKAPMEGVDVVFHLAAFYELGIAKSEMKRMADSNIRGTENVLALAKSLNIPKIIYVSTVYALGATGEQIADENFKHCGSFTCEYERTKFEAHQITKKYVKEGLPVIMILPAAVYGEDDPSVIGITFDKLITGKFPGIIKGSENSKFTYVHVQDVVAGILLALEKGKAGEEYILSGEVMRFIEMIESITKIAGVKAPTLRIPLQLARLLAFFDERVSHFLGRKPMVSQEALNSLLCSFAVSSAKAKTELGFSPRSNQAGFSQTIEYLKRK